MAATLTHISKRTKIKIEKMFRLFSRTNFLKIRSKQSYEKPNARRLCVLSSNSTQEAIKGSQYFYLKQSHPVLYGCLRFPHPPEHWSKYNCWSNRHPCSHFVCWSITKSLNTKVPKHYKKQPMTGDSHMYSTVLKYLIAMQVRDFKFNINASPISILSWVSYPIYNFSSCEQ